MLFGLEDKQQLRSIQCRVDAELRKKYPKWSHALVYVMAFTAVYVYLLWMGIGFDSLFGIATWVIAVIVVQIILHLANRQTRRRIESKILAEEGRCCWCGYLLDRHTMLGRCPECGKKPHSFE